MVLPKYTQNPRDYQQYPVDPSKNATWINRDYQSWSPSVTSCSSSSQTSRSEAWDMETFGDSKHDKHAIFVTKKGGDSRPKKLSLPCRKDWLSPLTCVSNADTVLAYTATDW